MPISFYDMTFSSCYCNMFSQQEIFTKCKFNLCKAHAVATGAVENLMSCSDCRRPENIFNILYFCRCLCDCLQCLFDWEVQTWQMAPCHNRWDSAVLLKLVSLRFMHSTLRYCPKCKGHQKALLPLILNHCCDVFTIML